MLCGASRVDIRAIREGVSRHPKQGSMQGQDARGRMSGFDGCNPIGTAGSVEMLQGPYVNYPGRTGGGAGAPEPAGARAVPQTERGRAQAAAVAAPGDDKNERRRCR